MVTLSGNDSKQIAAATSFRMSALFSEGQKNLVNSENKENLSNYQPLKREPSVCSTSLLFSKFITVVQFFFRVTPVLQWFQLNFGAGNFRGRRPGTSALRMLLRLTAGQSRSQRPRSFWSEDGDRDLWSGPIPEVRDSPTSCQSAHAQSQVWQIWLVLLSIYCVYIAIQNRNVVRPGQGPRFPAHDKRDPWGRGWPRLTHK